MADDELDELYWVKPEDFTKARSRLAAAAKERGERLRAAHSAMDGDQIRELSTQQRKLIDDLSRAAFDAAEVTNPSAALREDVTATLQAAIADSEVAARLGRLAKAERWSGFGDFGFTAEAAPAAKRAKKVPRENPELGRARTALTDAERVKAEVDAVMNAAEKDYAKAKQASRDAAELVKEAKAQLKKAGG